MVLVSAITASLKFHHIGLRAPTTKLDYRIYALFMAIGNGLLTFSVYSQFSSVLNSGVKSTGETLAIYWLWLALFGAVMLISIFSSLKHRPPNSKVKAILALPYSVFLCTPIWRLSRVLLLPSSWIIQWGRGFI